MFIAVVTPFNYFQAPSERHRGTATSCGRPFSRFASSRSGMPLRWSLERVISRLGLETINMAVLPDLGKGLSVRFLGLLMRLPWTEAP